MKLLLNTFFAVFGGLNIDTMGKGGFIALIVILVAFFVILNKLLKK